MSQFDILTQSLLLQPVNVRKRRASLHYRSKHPNTELEDYELNESIGEGGFGQVFKAIHVPTGEAVAVKVLKIDKFDPEQMECIEREIALHQKLMHEHIAQIYEVVRKPNKIYIIMEHCAKGELFDYITNNGPLGEREAARIFHEVLSALLYLKHMGISHRDVKPENILFDQERKVKLVDFGFSCKYLGEEDVFRWTICGTPSYTPPEILLQKPYSAELMDVWSLGVTFYAMMAAELPFNGSTDEEKRGKIISCNWSPQPFFSARVTKLLSSMLVESCNRATLSQLQGSEFMLAHQFNSADFIDFNSQILVPEESVLSVLQKQFGLDRKKVYESVKGYKLDKYHAAYYLVLKRESLVRKRSGGAQVSKYKKQRKSSLLKLEPIIRTPLQKHKEQDPLKSLKVDVDSARGRSLHPQNLVLNSCRLRRKTPDSPRRLIDCMALYKGE